MRFLLSFTLVALCALAVMSKSTGRRGLQGQIAARQATRSRILGRDSEKAIVKAASRRNGALRARASVAPATPYPGPETSTRTYAIFPNWNHGNNDLSADGVGPRLQVASFQVCLDQCNGWKTAHPTSEECTGTLWVPADGGCWLKGTNYASYQFDAQNDLTALMVGTCDFWTGSSAPRELPAAMAAVCQQLTAS